MIPQKVEISRKTIIFTILFILGLWFLYYIQDLIIELFVAMLIMTILDPVINFLSRFRIPRTLSVLITYVVLIGILVVLIVNLAPPLIEQSTNFVNQLPVYIKSLGIVQDVGDKAVEDFLSQVGILPAHFARFALSTFSNIIEVITVLIFAFYMLVSRQRLDDQIAVILGEDKKAKIADVINKLETRLGSWARGQLLLMLMVGVSTYIGLKLLGVPYALPLAILAGLLEIVPYVGPIIAAVPAVIIGFGTSPVIGVATTALAFLIQQIENYVFVPNIMHRSVGLSPLIVLLALAIGFRLFGVVGAIISIPAILAIQVLGKELALDPKKLT